MIDFLQNIAGFLFWSLIIAILLAAWGTLLFLAAAEFVGWRNEKKAEEEANKPTGHYYGDLSENEV